MKVILCGWHIYNIYYTIIIKNIIIINASLNNTQLLLNDNFLLIKVLSKHKTFIIFVEIINACLCM